MTTKSEEDGLRDDTRRSLERMQQFECATLSQEARLGNALQFQDVVQPAERLVGLYEQISVTVLTDLPVNELNHLRNQANADYNRFSQVLEFEPNQNNPKNVRDSLVRGIEDAYQTSFSALHQLISYSTSKSADFKRLESEARAVVQAVQDKAVELTRQLEQDKATANSVLGEIRKVAAEQGVSQQAYHFSQESKSHVDQSNAWLKATIVSSAILLLWAIATLFLHKIDVIKPSTAYDSVQLALSKFMIFGVVSFAVYLSAKNFLTHKHNAIVNKHRQNALATYTELVKAAGEKVNGDIILTQAAACIFSPQPTGYTSSKPFDGATAKSVVELLGKPMATGD